MRCPICLRETMDTLCSICKKIYIWDKAYNLFRKKKNIKKTEFLNQWKLFKSCKVLYPIVFEEVSFPDCIGSKGAVLRFDIYIPEKKLLIEYDGDQHQKFDSFYHKSYKEFQERQLYDRLKEIYASGHDFVLIKFTKEDKVDQPHEVSNRISQSLKKG